MVLSAFKTLLGLFIIGLSLYYSVFAYTDTAVHSFVFHLPSLYLVIGAVFGVSLLFNEFRDYQRFLRFFTTYSVSAEKKKTIRSEEDFEELLNVYITKGPAGMGEMIREHNLPFIWHLVATKLEIKVPISDIKDILNFKIRKIVAKLDEDLVSLRQLGALSPAIGMFGSVLGLIRLLANMADFSSLGANMSLALITTLYGIFLSNIVFVPLTRLVEKRKNMTIKNHENIKFWLSTLEENKPSFYLKNKLRDIATRD